MTLLEIYTDDLCQDRDLVFVHNIGLRVAREIPTGVLFGDKVIELRPYEILVDLKRLEAEFRITKEFFLEKLNTLVKLRKVKIIESAEYVRVEYLVRFPINPVDVTRDPSNPTTDISYSEWQKIDLRYVKDHFSEKYFDMVKKALEDFSEVVGKKNLSEIDHYDYDEYIRRLKQRDGRRGSKMSFVSINNYTRALKASFKRACKQRLLQTHPFRDCKPLNEIHESPVIFQQSEVGHMLSMIQGHWFEPVFHFALATAMREGEIVSRKWSDIDWEKKTIPIRRRDDFHPKGNRERVLPMSEEIETLLKRIQCSQKGNGIESDYVFLDDNGNKLTGDRVGKELKKVVRAIGLNEKLTFHSLRRTAATKMLFQGIPIQTIQAILGHVYIRTTLRYLGVPDEEMDKGMEALKMKNFLPSDWD